jgi:hypothetical protein
MGWGEGGLPPIPLPREGREFLEYIQFQHRMSLDTRRAALGLALDLVRQLPVAVQSRPGACPHRELEECDCPRVTQEQLEAWTRAHEEVELDRVFRLGDAFAHWLSSGSDVRELRLLGELGGLTGEEGSS